MHYPERRQKPRDTDRLKTATERLEEALFDARLLRSQLDTVMVGIASDESPAAGKRLKPKTPRDA